ncbi:MAG: pilus assembly protein PilZ [Moraxellaceae bacterium]|nr:MAG: pilus assembly protein PilZ [Moraxellaceae bacterium]
MNVKTVEEINQRKVARRHLIYYLRVFNGKTGELLGNLVDISTCGIMLVSDNAIALEKSYVLKMVLPETVEGSKEVEFEAFSRWCKNDVNPDFYDTGFELIDPTSSFLEVVDKLVEDCLFKN